MNHAPPSSSPRPRWSRSNAAATGGALALALAVLPACGALLKLGGYPPEALRESPPPELAAHALAVGSTAPDIVALGAGGEAWSLAEARATGRVALVFFRGHW